MASSNGSATKPKPLDTTHTEPIYDEEDDEFWQEMEVVKKEEPANGLDEEDQKKYHYVSPKRSSMVTGNATGIMNRDDVDYQGNEWRTKQSDGNENDYTRVRLDEDEDNEEIHMRTKFLFDEDKAMTPLSQMQTTKNLLTESQRIAYVGLCYLTCREMTVMMRKVGRKELQPALKALELWSLRIMGRLYYHMEIALPEQKMMETLAEHGVSAMDLVSPLMTTHTVANPEYDPVEAKRAKDDAEREKAEATAARADGKLDEDDDWDEGSDKDKDEDENKHEDEEGDGAKTPVPESKTFTAGDVSKANNRIRDKVKLQTTANVLDPTESISVPGVSTSLSKTDENITLDVRWTVLCDLFLILVADSEYDARSRVLLEAVAMKLGLGWAEVIRFEKRVTDALEIEEGEESLDNKDLIENRIKSGKRRRYIMMGLATVGGGLVIGLSAGLFAVPIGVGLATALSTIGIGGTAGFLGGAGGIAMITTGATLTGSHIAVKGMGRRTQAVTTFDLLPLHNNKRVNCILTVPGFMTGIDDDPRLPFSVLDPIIGDVFSVRWEPEMMEETGNALRILTTEVLSQVSTTVLQATVMTGLMAGLQWPMLLTKLGYLIDNPWSNALDRSKLAGLVLADVLKNRTLGVRPITLIGFSLGARAIFYALVELARQKAFGIVQDVFILGPTLTAPVRQWIEARSVVAGRFVNGFARNDWILGYLFRATTGGVNTVAGLRPIENVPGLENIDLTDKIAGHLSYRVYMPLILDQLGFPVSADFFDEPNDMKVDREVVREGEEGEEPQKKGVFGIFGRGKEATKPRISRPPGHIQGLQPRKSTSTVSGDDDLPERMSNEHAHGMASPTSMDARPSEDGQAEATKKGDDNSIDKPSGESGESEEPSVPYRAGFDFKAITAAIGKEGLVVGDLPARGPHTAIPPRLALNQPHAPLERSESAPPLKTTNELPASPTPSTPSSTYRDRDAYISPPAPNSAGSVEDMSAQFAAVTMYEVNGKKFSAAAAKSAKSAPLTTRSPYGQDYGGDIASYASPTSSMDTPALSFGGADGTVWTPGTIVTGTDVWTPMTATFANSSTETTFGQQADSSSNANANANANTNAKGGKSTYPYNLQSYTPAESNPFASSTISFGSLDGTISPGKTDVERDSWAPKPIAGSKRPAYTMNPWDN